MRKKFDMIGIEERAGRGAPDNYMQFEMHRLEVWRLRNTIIWSIVKQMEIHL